MSDDTVTIESRAVDLDGLNLHYLQAGDAGEPVLLVHGWPTSAYLWRNIMAPLARHRRVIAPDLPGFGESDKPPEASYSLNYHARTLDAFLGALGVERTALVVHDLGGPVGLLWAVRNPEKVSRLAVLNTIVYPQVSMAVKAFIAAAFVPGLNTLMSSAGGISRVMNMGVSRSSLDEETLRRYQEPFSTPEARQVLLKTLKRLHPGALEEIAAKLPTMDWPTRIIYGTKDRLLPAVAKDMERLRDEMPQATLTALDCGHFLQEDDPETVARLLAEFLADDTSS